MPASVQGITSSTPMGASLSGGGATFRVWAPNATSVHVRGSFNGFAIHENASLVRGDAGYWHGFIAGVAADQ
jgi:1,4-alpha-glucan branching enzyme